MMYQGISVAGVLIFAVCSVTTAITSRMIGGNPAYTGQFPHHAAIRGLNRNNIVIAICSGSVTGDRWVITAASCVLGSYVVQAGLGSIHFDSPEVVMTTKTVHVHPYYQNGDVRYNIALLEFNKRIPFSQNIKPILVAENPCVNCYDETILVSGFGSSDNQPIDLLQYVRVKLLNAQTCNRYFPSPLLCSIGYEYPEQCPYKNDAGAALILRTRRPDQLYVQLGLFASMTNAGCIYGDPVAYLDITLFLDWLRSFGIRSTQIY